MPSSIEQQIRTAGDHHAAGRIADTEQICREVLSEDPACAGALHLLGAVAFHQGRVDEAIDLVGRAVTIDPLSSDYQNDLVELLRISGRPSDAAAVCLRAIELRPDFPAAYVNLGVTLQQMGHLGEAVGCYRKALQLQPDFALAYSNLGVALKELNNLDESIDCCRRAIELNPNLPEAYSNLSTTLRALARFDEALAVCRQGLACRPDDAVVHFNLAMTLLLRGDFEQGWDEYEWRLQARGLTGPDRATQRPVWDGSDPAGQTVLVYSEQGFGDVIQFARYVPMLAARGAKVVFECPPELVSLMGSLDGAGDSIRIIPTGESPGDIDLQVSVLSLPKAFRTKLSTIPAKIPYLSADPTKAQYWKAALAADELQGLRVGLVWSGNKSPDPLRSCSLSELEPLGEVQNVTLLSLQKGPGSEQIGSLTAQVPLVNRAPELQDFSDTAAFVSNVDLVICIDTAVAHLCGALGVRTWTMLPFVPDWRWLEDRGDSPWYPTMRLFRQKSRADWAPVVAAVTSQLRRFADGAFRLPG